MNRYKIYLKPEMSKVENVNLEPTYELVLANARNFSDEGRMAINKKWIEEDSVKINGDCIELILCSEAWLNFPTKALRGFISKLAATDEYRTLITNGGRLFKGDAQYIEEEIDVTEEELTDEQTLIEVTKLFFRESEENRRKINEIKTIIGGRVNE